MEHCSNPGVGVAEPIIVEMPYDQAVEYHKKGVPESIALRTGTGWPGQEMGRYALIGRTPPPANPLASVRLVPLEVSQHSEPPEYII